MDVNETQNHYSPSSNPQTRQKIVEILAATANGCFSELGYVPGMPQKLRELERQNEEWKLENMKLYQDNASLLDLIHQQDERIKEIGAPDPEKNLRIIELNSELQKTRTQRDELARARAANNSTPSELQLNYMHLQDDYFRVMAGYRTKCAEVQRLQAHIRTLVEQFSSRFQGPQTPTQQHQPQQQSQQQSRPPVQQHQLQQQFQSRPPVQQHLQHKSQQQTRPQVQQHPQHQLQQHSQQQSRPQIQHHLQSQPLHQLQPVHDQRPQSNHPAQRQSAPTLPQPHVQNHQHPQPVPDMSGHQPGQQRNTQSPLVYGQVSQQTYSLSQTQQAQRNTQSPPVFGQMSKHPLSQTQQAIFDQRYQAILQSQQHRPRQSSGSMPGSSTRAGQESSVNMANPQQHSPLLLDGPSILARPNSKHPHFNGLCAAQSTAPIAPTMSEPFATRSRTSLSNNSGPPTPAVSPHPLLNHPPLNHIIVATPSSDLNLDSIPPLNKDSSAPIERDTSTYVSLTISPQDTYLRVNQVPSPQVKDVQSFNTGTSISPVASPVASQPVNDALGFPASISPQQVNPLKRDSSSGFEDQHDLTEQLQKRPRLESPQIQLPTNTQIEPAADGTENIDQMDVDEDEAVEVGPDGLRLVDDCISDLFGEEGEGERRYCKLCIARRTMGYRADSPKPFVNATNDELQEHCLTEHAEAWEALRQTV